MAVRISSAARALGFSQRADGRVRHTAVVSPATGRDRAVMVAVKRATGRRPNCERGNRAELDL